MSKNDKYINLKEIYNKFMSFIKLNISRVCRVLRVTQNKILRKIKRFLIQERDKCARKIDLYKQKYNSLAPRDDIKNSATVDMLKKALLEKNNKNVALSGKYGAGKSSIVLSALKKQNKLKPLYISLGMLGINDEEIQEKEAEIISRSIEKSIIQQIIYKEKSNKFPASRIKRIPYINKIIIFFITLAVAFNKFEIVQKISKNFINILIQKYTKIISDFCSNSNNIKILEFFKKYQYIDEIVKVIIMLLIIYLLSKYIVGFIRRYSLKNIKLMFFEENEIEIENVEESLINKYMDELVYFFEMTNYNLLVIEDLDRFLESDKLKQKVLIIFQKLKELNQVLNATKQLNKRKITFLYVVKDDLFDNEEERTKFFDFIVPKIPEISTYNSYAKLRKLFKEKTISNKFLQQISTFIKDYRVIKNLKNEFDLYKRELIGDGIDEEKLLSMIVLKNLRPKEYEELIDEEGNLYNFIKNKNQLYQKQEETLKQKIRENKEKILDIENEKIKDLRELKSLALGNLACEEASRAYGVGISKSEFLDDSFDIDSIESNTIQIRNYTRYCFSEEQLFKDFGGKDEFVKRARKIENKVNDEIKRIKEETKKVEKQIADIHKLNIFELLKQQSDEEIEQLDEFEIMMLRNGYIDENYKNYCFKFGETEEIKRNDFSYILNVRQDKITRYDFYIEKPENVILELDELFFEKKAIWNFRILDQLITEKNSKKLSKFIDTLIEINAESYEFIIGYIGNSQKKNELLNLLYSRKKEIIYDIFNFGVQNGNDEDELVELLLNIPEILTEENLKNSIVEYIIERISFDVWFELNDNVKKSFKLLEIEFSDISDIENNIDLLEFIYENDLYEINEKMLKSIFIYFGFKDTEYEQNSLSLILNSDKLKKLKQYVLRNKEQFIRKCFINTNGIKNDIVDLIECINTWEIDYELKNILITKIFGKIDDISKIKDLKTMYPLVLENDKMEVSWENVFKIYCAIEELTDELITYIERNIVVFENKKIFFDMSENEKEKHIEFRRKLARCNNIKFEIYTNLLGKLNIYLNLIEKDEIENQRLEVLIKMKILRLNVNTFNVVREQKIDSLAEFVSLNIDEFIKLINEVELDNESIEKIILCEEIKSKYKTIMLSKINLEILTISSIKYIIENYKKNGISNISEDMKISFLKSDIEIDSKIVLLNKELEKKIDETRIKEYISYLPENYCRIGDINFSQTSIPKNKLNEGLIRKLENKIKISSRITKNKIIIYNIKISEKE